MKKKIGILLLVFTSVLLLTACGTSEKKEKVEPNNQEKEEVKENIKYTLTGKELGEYGKKVTLNANSDSPTDKYLYKIPAGTYKVTTTWEKVTNLWIVKDEVVKTGDAPYEEELSYVGEAYWMTNGTNDLNGKAKKEVEITLKEDESILILDTETFIFEKLDK